VDAQLLNTMLNYLEFGVHIDREYFRSGQRVVYFGKTKDQDADVVVKYCIYNETRVARIQREINILCKLTSTSFPNIIKYQYVTNESIQQIIDNLDPEEQRMEIEFLKASNLKPFFVTVEGFIPNIKWSEAIGNPPNQKRLIDLLLKIFEALSMLWGNKIVHRDLKPDNILITPSLNPVIIDLGIAKSLNEGTKNITNPIFGSPCTPWYASPEQMTIDGDVTYKSDQFSMGVLAFEALCGRHPYGSQGDASIEEITANIASNQIQSFESAMQPYSLELRDFIRKLLEYHPYKRFRQGAEIVGSLLKLKENIQ
jgi:serine/threonine protein kinase